MLNVSEETITKFSIVSSEVAVEMAKNAKEKLKSNYSIAVTGNAGPSVDNTNKSVGVVYIAIATDDKVYVEEFNFGKPRGRVIDKTVNKSLELLQKELLKNK